MKIHALTSFFGISQAAFYGNAYTGNQYNQYIPRPGPIGYMPMHPNRPSSGTVPSKPVPAEAKRQVHQGALCGKITDFRWAVITWQWLCSLPVASETTKYTKLHQSSPKEWPKLDRMWPQNVFMTLIWIRLSDFRNKSGITKYLKYFYFSVFLTFLRNSSTDRD